MVPYLLIADVLNTILSATLVFADRVLYPSYSDAPHIFGLSAREDQAAAGAIMWVLGAFAFLVPAMLIAVECLAHRRMLHLQRLTKRRPILAGSWHRAVAKLGLSLRAADTISFVVLFLAVGLAFSAVMASAGPDEDDLAVRARQQSRDLAVSVYAGDELTVGANDISVLVRDASGSPALGAQVEVIATREGATPGGEIHGHETDADNKLLHSATIDLPTTGTWSVRVDVRSELQSLSLTFPAESVVPQPGIEDWWPYLIIPTFALLLLVVHSRRARRHQPTPHKRVEPSTAPS
jgi:hypothetical protein